MVIFGAKTAPGDFDVCFGSLVQVDAKTTGFSPPDAKTTDDLTVCCCFEKV